MKTEEVAVLYISQAQKLEAEKKYKDAERYRIDNKVTCSLIVKQIYIVNFIEIYLTIIEQFGKFHSSTNIYKVQLLVKIYFWNHYIIVIYPNYFAHVVSTYQYL